MHLVIWHVLKLFFIILSGERLTATSGIPFLTLDILTLTVNKQYNKAIIKMKIKNKNTTSTLQYVI